MMKNDERLNQDLELEDFNLEFWKEEETGISQNATSITSMSQERIKFIRLGDTGNNSNEKDVETVLNELFLIKQEPVKRLGSSAINPRLLEIVGHELVEIKFIGKYIQSKTHIKPYEFFMLLGTMEDFVLFVEQKTGINRLEWDQELLSNVSLYDEFLQIHPDNRSVHYLGQLYQKVNPFGKVDFSHYRTPETIKMDHFVVNRFLVEKEKDGASPETIIHYEGTIRRLFHWLLSTHREFENDEIDQFPIFRLTQDHLREYERYLLLKVKRNELSKWTVHVVLYEIKAFLSDLYQKKWIIQDVTDGLKPIKPNPYRYRDIPSKAELQRLFTVIDIYSDDPVREKLVYGLMLHLGLRLCEVAPLKWDSINLSNSTVSLVRKGNKPSKMYLPNVVKRYLEEFPITQQKGYLFGKSGAYERIYRNYKIYALLAGWEYTGGCHIFRHVFLTYLSYFSNPQLLMRLGDFNRLETVSRYIHRHEQKMKEAINKLKMKQ
jgi:integrase/recombinase XerD